MDILTTIADFSNYFSITVLLLGVIRSLFVCTNRVCRWTAIYMSIILLTEGTNLYFGKYGLSGGLVLFSVSFFLHYLSLNYFYYRIILKTKGPYYPWLQVIGIIPLLIHFVPFQGALSVAYYARIPYSLWIAISSLVVFYHLLTGRLQEHGLKLFLLNSTILAFFTLDTYLATGTEFLLSKDYMKLVAWFWFVRGFFLQAFYIALIYYSWQSSKPIEQAV